MFEPRLLLLGCSHCKKLDTGILPAIDRYDGPSFRLLRRFLEQNSASPVDVKILSAEYGLIPTTYPLPYYDRRMTKERSQILHPQVIQSLETILNSTSYTNLLFCLGRDYLETFYGYEGIIPSGLTVQFATGGIGRKLSILHDWLYESSSSLRNSKIPTSSKPKVHIRGIEVNLVPEQILEVARLAIAEGERRAVCCQSWYVEVDDQRVSPKWLISQITGLPVRSFHTDNAIKVLQKLGVKVYFDRIN